MPTRPLLAALALVVGLGACSDSGSSSDGGDRTGRPTTTTIEASSPTEPPDRSTTTGAAGAATSTTEAGGAPTTTTPDAPSGPDEPAPPATTLVDGIGVPLVDVAAVEAQVVRGLTAEVGQAPDGVDCPGPLVGQVGATLRCELTDADERYPVTLTVTAVVGDEVSFDFAVGEAPIA